MNGKLAAALDLSTLAGRTHLYGLGPLAELRGEVTIGSKRRKGRSADIAPVLEGLRNLAL